MKVSRYPTLLFVLLPLFSIGLGSWYYVQHSAGFAAAEKVLEDDRQLLFALGKLRQQVQEQMGFLESEIIRMQLGPDTKFESPFAPRTFSQRAVHAIFKNDRDDLQKHPAFARLLKAIEQFMQKYGEIKISVTATPEEKLQTILSGYQEGAIPLAQEIYTHIDQLSQRKREAIAQRQAGLDEERELLLYICLGIVLLSLLIGILGIVFIGARINKPLRQMLHRLEDRQKLSGGSHELGTLASHINRIHTEIAATEHALDQAAKGHVDFVLKEDALGERQLAALTELKSRLRQMQGDIQTREKEAAQQRDKARATQQELDTTRETLENQLKGLQAPLAVLEFKADGSLLLANDTLTELTGIGFTDMLASHTDYAVTEAALAPMWQAVTTQGSWRGTLRLKSKKHAAGLLLAAAATKLSIPGGEKYVLLGTDITRLADEKESAEARLRQTQLDLESQRRAFQETTQKLETSDRELAQHRSELEQAQQDLAQRQQVLQEAQEQLNRKNEELRSASAAVDSAVNEAEQNKAMLEKMQAELAAAQQELDSAHSQVQTAEQSLQAFNREHEAIRANFERQKHLENRLVQQQSALQELTRNKDLKEGNVREAVRSVTEAAAYALEQPRVGLWLFIDNGTRMRCLDLFNRDAMQHSPGPDLLEKDVALFFQTIKKEPILAPSDPRGHNATVNLVSSYMEPFHIQGIMAAAVRLGGNHVGMLMVERTDGPHPWALDEQNFLVAVADVVSLALEQGNRRAMEEELRMTLEESQALEEELRQNAEEIEATNEEMRRTQVELRGQIAALNNAAIVSETNLEGRITYANEAFMATYRYDQKEVLGKNHNILNSSEHTPEFWQDLWGRITQGLVFQGEICNKAKDGEIVWTNVTITPVLGMDGTPYKYINVAFNITERKLQETQIQSALDIALEQEELLRRSSSEMVSANDEMRRTQLELAGQISALNNSSLVFETNVEGTITYVNPALLEASSFSKEQLIGQGYQILRSGRQPEGLYQEQWKSILNGKIWRGELDNKRADGSYFWAVTTSTPVLNEHGEPVKIIHVLFDISEQKQQEFRLKRQQTALSKLSQHGAVKEGNVEGAFQEVTRVARETLDVTRVSVWLFDESRQNLVCRTYNQQGEHLYTEGALLAVELYPTYFHSLENERIVAASDALNDHRTRELAPGLLQPSDIRSIMDCVITVGLDMVGVLSIESKGNQRMWTLDEQGFAGSISETVGLVLEQKERLFTDRLKDAYAQLELKNKDIARQKTELEETTIWLKESIRYAKRIQQNILPSKAFMDETLENYFVVYRPKDVVGGDFYWYSPVGNQCVMVVADGTGHGVPGAFLTLIGYLLLNQIVMEKRVVQPAEILRLLHLGVRTALKQDDDEGSSRDGFDMAVATFNLKTYEVEYAGANLPFYYYQDWEVHEVKPTKKSIGGEQLEEERTFQNHQIQLRQGDAIYMYTDGFVDQMGGPQEKRFTSRRFRDLILRTQHESLATQRALLNLEWKDWKEDREQLDDVTVFGLKFN
jgi:PAS domain S-box-containing protein